MSRDYKKHYDGYYPERSTWREIGAFGKAANVEQLWSESCAEIAAPQALEIGCGDGSVMDVLRERGYRLHGVELSESGAEVARSRGFSVDSYDGSRLPYDDNAFDLAVLTHVIEHVENPRLVLDEAARVAEWVFVEVPLEYRWRTPRDFEWTDVGHINLYDQKLIRHLLQSTGLEVVSELIGGPRVEVYQFRKGSLIGRLTWVIRESARVVLPPVARRLFTYHGAFLCRVPR